MASVTRDARASMDTSTAMYAPQISGLIAGEDIALGAPCYIKASDGKLYNATGAAVNAAAKIDGFSGRNAKAGQALTIYGKGTRFRWGSALTPAQDLFLDAVAGGLNTVATTGGLVAIARAINDTDIRVTNDAT